MKEKGVFIVAYGIDGVGKSELVRGLTKKIQNEGFDCLNFEDYKSQHLIENPFSDIKKQVAKEGTPTQEYLNFLNSTIQQSKEIRKLLDSGTSVVKDRYMNDVIAHALRRGVSNAEKIGQSVIHEVVQPDYSGLLTVDEVKRMGRIQNRGIIDEYDTIANVPGTRLFHFENFFRKKLKEKEKLGTGLVIDTTELSLEEVSDAFLQFILGK